MLKRMSWALILALLLTTLALPALAVQGGGGGIHLGPYTLAEAGWRPDGLRSRDTERRSHGDGRPGGLRPR
jgi:hypothetical protein